MTNNKTLKAILACTLSFILMYLITSFIQVDINFMNWGHNARVATVLFWVIAAFISCVNIHTN